MFILWIVPFRLSANPCELPETYEPLLGCTSFYEDKDHTESFDTVLEQAFQPLEKEQVGYTRSAWWLKLTVEAAPDEPFSGTLIAAPQGCDNIEVQIVSSRGTQRFVKFGDKIPFYEREVESRLQGFRIHMQPGESVSIVLRYTTTNSLRFPLTLYEEHSFEKHNANERLLYGIYFGVLLVMIIYNLALFFAVRDVVSVDYLLFLITFAIGVASLTGFAFEYFWPAATNWTDKSHPFFMNLALFFGMRFIRRYINAKNFAPYLDQTIRALGYSALVFAVISLGPFVRLVSVATQLMVLASVPVVLVTSIRGAVLKVRPAKYLMTAWILLLVGAVLYALASMGAIPFNLLTSNMLLIGSAIDMLIFSLGLGERYSELRVRSREYEMQLDIARIWSKSLLPNLPATIDRNQLQYRFRPMNQVGGDLIDVFEAENGLGLFICDVSGHGIGASLLSSMVKVAITGLFRDYVKQPSAMIDHLYQSLVDKFGDQYLTACAVWIDQKDNKLRYARAGHEDPILLRKNGNIEILNAAGTILHTRFYQSPKTQEVDLEAGDTLFLFTDGLTAPLNQDLVSFGDSELLPLIEKYGKDSLIGLCDRFVIALDQFSKEYRDDLAILIYRHR